MSQAVDVSAGAPQAVQPFFFPGCFNQIYPDAMYREVDEGKSKCVFKFDAEDCRRIGSRGKSESIWHTNTAIAMMQTEVVGPLKETHLIELLQAKQPADAQTIQKVDAIIRRIEGFNAIPLSPGLKDTPLQKQGTELQEQDLRNRILNLSQTMFKLPVAALIRHVMATKRLDQVGAIQELFHKQGCLADGLVREILRRMAIDIRRGSYSMSCGLMSGPVGNIPHNE